MSGKGVPCDILQRKEECTGKSTTILAAFSAPGHTADGCSPMYITIYRGGAGPNASSQGIL